jgi:tRNA (guanine37-N1)-methyltransferase
MNIYIITIFPNMFESVFGETIIKRAIDKDKISIETVDLRGFTHDKHRSTDDYPYGGGAGMVMKPEPVYEAMDYVKSKDKDVYTILFTPKGKIYNQKKAHELKMKKSIALICGRYEGFDERIRYLADEEMSVGKFILSGGEIAAMVVVDSVVRLIPGVLGNEESLIEETFEGDLVEYPQYTRPKSYRGMDVPDILLSGNHQKIREWRRNKSLDKSLNTGVENG